MNRLTCLLATLACALLMSVVYAQDAPSPAGQQPAGGPGGPGRGGMGGPGFGFRMPAFPLLETLDADKDGKLSKEEIDAAVAALKKLDKDGDGKLSKEEIGWPPAGMGRRGPGMMGFGGPGFGPGGFGGGPGGNPVDSFMSNDKNGDGKVTKEELPNPMQQFIERADTNKDGAVDKSEVEAVMNEMGRRGGMRGGPGGFGGGPGGGADSGPVVSFVDRIMNNDKDSDGKVTKEELPERMQWMVQRLDTNQDGAIDKAEAEAAAAPRVRRGGAAPGANPGGEQPKDPPANPDGK